MDVDRAKTVTPSPAWREAFDRLFEQVRRANAGERGAGKTASSGLDAGGLEHENQSSLITSLFLDCHLLSPRVRHFPIRTTLVLCSAFDWEFTRSNIAYTV